MFTFHWHTWYYRRGLSVETSQEEQGCLLTYGGIGLQDGLLRNDSIGVRGPYYYLYYSILMMIEFMFNTAFQATLMPFFVIFAKHPWYHSGVRSESPAKTPTRAQVE